MSFYLKRLRVVRPREVAWRACCSLSIEVHSRLRYLVSALSRVTFAAWARVRPPLRHARELASATVRGFSKDRGELLAAALAFHTLLSLAPLVILAVAMAGLFLGEGAARAEVSRTLADTMGPAAASSVDTWVEDARASSGVASVVGLALLVFGASRVTGQLRIALNQVWNVDLAEQEGFRENLREYVKRRLFAFAMVLGAGPALLAVFASRTGIEALGGLLGSMIPVPTAVLQLLQQLTSLVLVFALAAVVFKLVPDTRIGWRSACMGAALTSVLFNAGNYLIALYLGRSATTQTYGAAAAVVLVLLWLYFSAQLFLLGAEFTQAYAERFGRGLSPREAALRAREQGAAERARVRLSEKRSRGGHGAAA
jgi:membrane protein